MAEPNGRLRALLEQVLKKVEDSSSSTIGSIREMRDDLKRVEDDVKTLKERNIREDAKREALETQAEQGRTFWEQFRGWMPWIIMAISALVWAVASGWRPS